MRSASLSIGLCLLSLCAGLTAWAAPEAAQNADESEGLKQEADGNSALMQRGHLKPETRETMLNQELDARRPDVKQAEAYEQGANVVQDLDLAAQYYKTAVSHGSVYAKARLGKLYFYGGNNYPPNHKLGLDLLKEAALEGSDYARIVLGSIYTHGFGGLPANKQEGTYWYELALKSGSPSTTMDVAIAYLNKEQLNDEKKGFKLMTEAAILGNCQAEFNLGLLYEFGQTREPNERLAKAWFERAAAHGDQEARRKLEFMEAREAKSASLDLTK